MPHDDDPTTPMNALRILRGAAQAVVGDVPYWSINLTPVQLRNFRNAIIVASAVPGIDDQPPLPITEPMECPQSLRPE